MSNSTEAQEIVETADNSIVCEAISERLLEVSRTAERLDRAIKDTSKDLNLDLSSATDSDGETNTNTKRKSHGNTSDVSRTAA